MKKFIISLVLFFVLTLLVIVHSMVMWNFGKSADKLSETIKSEAQAENWEKVREKLGEFEQLWEKRRTWVALTVKTNIIEEIDISLEQSKAHAENETKPDFLGEFIMLKKLVSHIPDQEGFHIEEIL